MAHQPQVVILAGPNGAGKSTTAPRLLVGELGVGEFVNADVIARGLSGFRPEQVSIRAGRIMLERIHELAAQQLSFSFETTLASRSFAPLVRQLRVDGYGFHLLFLWLRNPQLAVERVVERVRLGGHSVPTETVLRRYDSGLRNLFDLYQPLADRWSIYDNSDRTPRVVASGSRAEIHVADKDVWETIKGQHANARK